ncbi:MAG: PilZ domain-containing protein [Gammaproteobacteria bacterium]|nr:MAG: PilZ domain-containing protein [Gammaproteobacteria bacterium]
MVIFERDSRPEDRRNDMRFAIKVKAVYQSDSGAKCLGLTENISSSGLLFNITQSQGADDLAEGDTGSIAIMADIDGKQTPLVLKCEIVHIGENGIGFNFKNSNINTMAMLEQFIMCSL